MRKLSRNGVTAVTSVTDQAGVDKIALEPVTPVTAGVTPCGNEFEAIPADSP
jgi:hypothetical protein